MRTATDPYFDWYGQLDQEIQSDISSMIIYMWPDHPLEPQRYAPNVNNLFSAWIQQGSADRYKTVGKTLALIKLTEFIFISPRGTDEDWDLVYKRMNDRLESAKARRDEADTNFFGEIVEALPERSHRWIAAAAAWRALRCSTLSEDALHSCLVG